jgi:hypothetical protein
MIARTGGWVAVLLASMSTVALGATVRVPQDQPTIQAGLAAASSGDTVLVAYGRYTEHDIVVTPGVCLRSETGLPDCVTIDAQGFGRVLQCVDASSTTSIVGLTLSGGRVATAGGGLLLSRAPITVSECIFRGNHAEEGAGCFVSGGNATFDRCQFVENMVDVPGPGGYFAGGGIYCYGCSPAFNECEFLRNSGDLSGIESFWGGGVFLYGSTASPTFTRCLLADNDVGGGLGGGIDADAGATPAMADCVFRGNHGGRGGALFLGTQWASITGTVFDANTAVMGGGVYFGWGGGSGFLSHCTLIANGAQEGGGICVDATAGTPTVERTIIAFGTQGEALLCKASSAATVTCSDINGNAGGDWVGCIADQAGQGGNFSADPLFCDRQNGDFHLCADSPCVSGGVCDVIGALGQGCGPCAPTLVTPTTWGAIKAKYR